MSTAQHTTSVECRDVPGFLGYRVGDDGSVWSRWNGRHGLGEMWKQLNPTLDSHGYRQAKVRTADGTKKSVLVHVLVLRAFVGEKLPGQETRHLDGNPLNNRLDNLCWGTRSENVRDRIRHGTFVTRLFGNPKLTPDQVREIREFRRGGMSTRMIARKFNVSNAHVWGIVKRIYWPKVADSPASGC